MAKKPRLSGEELFHHIYAWGNDRHPIFKADAHFERYLEYLSNCSDKYKIDVIAYALMNSHVHLFLYDKTGRLSSFMSILHGSYAKYYNKDTKRIGHVFGERFNNKIVQPNNYGLWLSRYIHRQAVEAGIVQDPKDYPWTSYYAYLGLSTSNFLKPEIIIKQFGKGPESFRRYEEFVMGEENDPIDWEKRSTLIVGDDEFIDNIQKAECKYGTKQREDDLLSLVSSLFSVSPATLLNPRGWGERRLRHRAFRILKNKYDYPVTQIAKAFKVTHRAVTKALKFNS